THDRTRSRVAKTLQKDLAKRGPSTHVLRGSVVNHRCNSPALEGHLHPHLFRRRKRVVSWVRARSEMRGRTPHEIRSVRTHGRLRHSPRPTISVAAVAARSLRPLRLLCLSSGRAPRDAAGACTLPQSVSRCRRAAHEAASLRSAGLFAAALSSDPA